MERIYYDIVDIFAKDLENNLVSADIHTQILGSDHCPIELVVKDL